MRISRSVCDGSEPFTNPALPGDMVMYFPFGSGIPSDFWFFNKPAEFGIACKHSELPAWFTLHPSEMVDEVAERMIPKLEGIRQHPDPVNLPNLWRAKAGDRLAYFFERPWTTPPENGFIIDIAQDALVYWQWPGGRCPNVLEAMGESPEEDDEKRKGWMAAASAKVMSLGLPRTASCEWGISSL